MTSTKVSFSILQERVGHYLFGIRTGFTSDQQSDIADCLNDGLRRVYSAHDWSFLRPVAEITTVIGESEIPLDAEFDAIANDSDLTYYPSAESWYPPVKWRHDSVIRQLEANNTENALPVFYSVRTVTFDPAVGSRKVLVLYPTPDKVYTLKVPMILRPVLLDATAIYPIGGEVLSQAMLEACLAAAEHNFEEREHVHEKRYMELIGLAIRDDQDRSSPTSLGRDAPRDEPGRFGITDYSHRLREQRIGSVSIDGITQ